MVREEGEGLQGQEEEEEGLQVVQEEGEGLQGQEEEEGLQEEELQMVERVGQEEEELQMEKLQEMLSCLGH